MIVRVDLNHMTVEVPGQGPVGYVGTRDKGSGSIVLLFLDEGLLAQALDSKPDSE